MRTNSCGGISNLTKYTTTYYSISAARCAISYRYLYLSPRRLMPSEVHFRGVVLAAADRLCLGPSKKSPLRDHYLTDQQSELLQHVLVSVTISC
jgi:hypothetical protein